VAESSLSIKELRAGYGSLDILNGVDLDVPQGQFVALMGPNGAGKSTLLKTLYGLTTVKGGRIDWQGHHGLQVTRDPGRRHLLCAAGTLQLSGDDGR
jgi:ABC-type branched-subunit amino acid transport system ATPase component